MYSDDWRDDPDDVNCKLQWDPACGGIEEGL